MHTEEDYIVLEQEERAITDEAILLMLLVLAGIKGDIEKELRAFYQQYGRDGVVTYSEARKWISQQDHQRRLTVLTLFVSGAFASALGDIETHFRRFLTDVVGKESTFFGVTLDVEKLLSRKWGADDLYWLQRLEADIDLWKVYVNNDIKRSMLQQKNIEDVIKLLEKRFNNINGVMERLGLTESTAVGSMSRRDAFSQLGITKYQFYTNPDEQRCETCGSMHGIIFPISAYEVGVTASPIHPRCRCWEVPIWE